VETVETVSSNETKRLSIPTKKLQETIPDKERKKRSKVSIICDVHSIHAKYLPALLEEI